MTADCVSDSDTCVLGVRLDGNPSEHATQLKGEHAMHLR